MVAKGVIRDVVPWSEARPYFYLRVRRRLAQDALVKALQAVDADLKHQDGVALVRGWCEADWEDDKAVLAWFESAQAKIEGLTAAYKVDAVGAQVGGLLARTPTRSRSRTRTRSRTLTLILTRTRIRWAACWPACPPTTRPSCSPRSEARAAGAGEAADDKRKWLPP